MQTERTLSRSTLTVQDVTVTSAIKPRLPSIATPRCDLRPTPGTALQPTKRRERFSRTFEHALLRPTNVLQSLVRTSVPWSAIRPCGYIHMDIEQSFRCPCTCSFIPRSKDTGLSEKGFGNQH
jgi:hypothetical protein